jgi:hypothetical protein
MRVGIDARTGHCRNQRRHLAPGAGKIPRGASARQECGAPSAMLPAIAIALRRAGAFAIAAIRSGNKIARRNPGGGTPCARIPAADNRSCDGITSVHAGILRPLGAMYHKSQATHLTAAASLRDN